MRIMRQIVNIYNNSCLKQFKVYMYLTRPVSLKFTRGKIYSFIVFYGVIIDSVLLNNFLKMSSTLIT